MDGLCRAIGGQAVFVLGGQAVLVKPLTLRDWGTIEQQILFERDSNPIGEVLRASPDIAAASPGLANSLLEQVAADLRGDKSLRTVRLDEMIAWMDGPFGFALAAWLCLKHNGGDCADMDKIVRTFSNLSAEQIAEFKRLRDQVSGVDLLASADWPDLMDGVRAEKRAKREAMLRAQTFPWRRWMRDMAIQVGIPPSDLADLTLYQVKMIMAADEDLIEKGTAKQPKKSVGTMTIGAAESRRMMRAMK